MKQINVLRIVAVPVMTLIVLMLSVLGAKEVDAAPTVEVVLSGLVGSESSRTFSKDPTFTLETSASWIKIKTPSPTTFKFCAVNNIGKGRVGYVYLKRQGVVVTTFKVSQKGFTTIKVGASKGSTSFIAKAPGQTIYYFKRGGTNSFLSAYQLPNKLYFRIDYTANTTGKPRIDYMYVLEGPAGSQILEIYEIIQEAN